MAQNENPPPEPTRPPAAEKNPQLQREMSRRGLITDEFHRAGKEALTKLPSLSPIFRLALRENEKQRDERLIRSLWQLLMGRNPEQKEMAASLEVVSKADHPETKGDALVDVAWALCQTKDFEALGRSDLILVRGFYKLALDREPTETEREAALKVIVEAGEPAARIAALEGLFTGLMRSWECVLRKPAGAPPRRR